MSQNVIKIEPYELTWIIPVVSQAEMEGLFQFFNLHLTELQLKPLLSFSQMKVDFLTEPKEALKLRIDVFPLGAPYSLELFKEAIWSEVLVSSHPGPKPLAISLQTRVSKQTPKKLVCFDMDSTLINQEVIDEIARTAGFYDQVSAITEAAMEGKLDFRASLKERVKLFYQMPKAQAEAIIPFLTLSPGAEKLLSHFRFQNIKTAIVSGGFEFILKHFQKQNFIDQVYGNIMTINDDERFTGELEEPIVDAEYKQKLVSRLKANYNLSADETVTVGDGANDLLMMKESSMSVSFCGKPKLATSVNTLILDRNLYWLKELME